VWVLFAVIATSLSGCGPRPVAGGTPGMLRAGNEPLSEVQITVHRAENGGWSAIGFGVADSKGAFELVTNDAAEALSLPQGEYRFTLESVGAPLKIPGEYTQPETTPLQVEWDEGESLDLRIPSPLVAL
jgi:hypothetical protein